MRTLTFGILCKAQIHAKCMLSLLEVLDKLNDYDVDLRVLVGFSNLPVARSRILTDWYLSHKEGDSFFFLDADQTFRLEDIRAILDLPGDVRCGLYASSDGTCIGEPEDRDAFFKGTSNRLLFAGCGLMAIHWKIVDRLAKALPQISLSDSSLVYPFFHQLIIQDGKAQRWLGEDFSFCYRVRQEGGGLTGLVSPTIGHEVYKVETL